MEKNVTTNDLDCLLQINWPGTRNNKSLRFDFKSEFDYNRISIDEISNLRQVSSHHIERVVCDWSEFYCVCECEWSVYTYFFCDWSMISMIVSGV